MIFCVYILFNDCLGGNVSDTKRHDKEGTSKIQ